MLVIANKIFDVAAVHLANCFGGMPGVPQIRRPSGDFGFIGLSVVRIGSLMDASSWWQRMRALAMAH